MIKTTTNFDYNFQKFLDDRQGCADTLRDLLEWPEAKPLPLGFEVFCEGDWYIYDIDYSSETTGHFRKRMEDVEKLMAEVFPLKLAISGGGTYETGTSCTVNITWSLKRNNEEVAQDNATVNGISVGTDKRYSPSDPITTTTTYTVKAWNGSLSTSGSVKYTFQKKKYWGASENEELTNEEILALSSGWAGSWKMASTNFDCTGGKYPYYVIPLEDYKENEFKMWIGGLRNTDFTASDATITKFGNDYQYKVIRLNNIQTGVLAIEFKD